MPSTGYLAMSRDIFNCDNLEGDATGIQWVQTR